MHPFYITHIRAHIPLPGPLTKGNQKADHLVVNAISNARHFHNLTHVNASGLKRRYSITWKEAKAIIQRCPTCQMVHSSSFIGGVNPQGLEPNSLWQMDVTHVPSFGRLAYVHVCVNTFSHFGLHAKQESLLPMLNVIFCSGLWQWAFQLLLKQIMPQAILAKL